MKFSQEQLKIANQVDLVAFLIQQGECLKKSGREWKWERNSSVTVRQNKWYQHKYEEGGFPIKFMQRFYNMNFVEAVSTLLEFKNLVPNEQLTEPEPQKEFKEPKKNKDMKRVYGYLMKRRFIESSIISEFAKRKLIFEDDHYNVVFAGYDEQGIMHHAHRKGTGSYSFGGNVEGSKPEYSFHFVGTSDTVFVFEAPIDLLSYIQLHKQDWQQHSYIANCGLSTKALHQFLNDHQNIKQIGLCLDHDIAGDEGISKFKEEFKDTGCHLFTELSLYKDWNEDVKALNGIEPLPAIENPKYEQFAKILDCVNEQFKEMQLTSISFKSLMNAYAEIYYMTKDNMVCGENLIKKCGKLSSIAFVLYQKCIEHEVDLVETLANDYQTHKDRGQLKTKLNVLKTEMNTLKLDYVKVKKGELCKSDMSKHFLSLAQESAMTMRGIMEMISCPSEEKLTIKKTNETLTLSQAM